MLLLFPEKSISGKIDGSLLHGICSKDFFKILDSERKQEYENHISFAKWKRSSTLKPCCCFFRKYLVLRKWTILGPNWT